MTVFFARMEAQVNPVRRVAVSLRIDDGIITKDNLPPQRAAILPRLV